MGGSVAQPMCRVGCAAYVLGGNQVENHATLWSNLQDCKISSRVEIPKLVPSVAKRKSRSAQLVEKNYEHSFSLANHLVPLTIASYRFLRCFKLATGCH